MSKPPLWKVMRAADTSCASDLTSPEAKAIIALRDWLVPEESEVSPDGRSYAELAYRLGERQRLRALLTAEADRAERGEVQS